MSCASVLGVCMCVCMSIRKEKLYDSWCSVAREG